MDLDQLFTNTDYKSTSITIPCFSEASSEASPPDNALTLAVFSSPTACTDFDLTGQILWPVSNLLAHFLASKIGQARIRHRRIVELGAGCGLPGLVAASLQADHVILTDGNEVVMDLLQKNIDSCLQQREEITCQVSAKQLTWGDRDRCKKVLDSIGHVDHIVAADVVQWPAVLEPLLLTTKALLWTSTAEDPSLILGIVNRASATFDLFFSLAKELGFSYRKISATEYLENGIVPESCKEFGGRQTEVYLVILTDRSQVPILLETTGEDVLLGKNYKNTSTLPC
jgi:hypothetical protein